MLWNIFFIFFVMTQTGDTAKTILEEYEGYTIEEMTGIVEKTQIIGNKK